MNNAAAPEPNSYARPPQVPVIRSGWEIATFILGIAAFIIAWFTVVLGVMAAVAGITVGILDLTAFKAQGTSRRAMTWIGIGLCGLTAILSMAAYSYNSTH